MNVQSLISLKEKNIIARGNTPGEKESPFSDSLKGNNKKSII
jgi:hypothetical protein